MAEVNLSLVEDAIRRAVRKAATDGMLETITIGQTRDSVEEQLSLEPGILKTGDYKAKVKAMIEDATVSVEEDRQEDEEEKPRKQTKGKKRKSETGNPAPVKKARATSSKSSATVPPSSKGKTKERKKKKGEEPKSLAVVVSDDDETNGESSTKRVTKGSSPKPSPGNDRLSSGGPPSKQHKGVVSEDEEGGLDQRAPASPPSGLKASAPQGKNVEDHGEKSESEMSVLINEPPKRSKKKSEDVKPSKGRKKKVPDEELSKEDQQIKRLKSLVLACGVRKVWAKEFKDMDPSAQIRRLKQILSELGMNGRMSLEQAKAIKEKRELAQELEDVQKFEQAVVSGPRRTRKKADSGEKEDDLSDDVISDVPIKRKNNARNHIMAFLGDQSDSG